MNVRDANQTPVKRLLIVDTTPGIERIIAKAHALGHSVALFSADGEPNASGADEVVNGDGFEPAQIRAAADSLRVDGVFPPFGTPLDVQITRLGFPALNEDRVHSARVQTVESAEAARAAATELGTPVWIAASGSRSQAAIHEVEHLEDLSLAFARVTRGLALKRAVALRPLRGRAFYVDGVVVDGTFLLSGVIERDMDDAPFLFDRALFTLPELSSAIRDSLVDVTVQALEALKCRNGCVHVGVILTDDGPIVLEVFGAPAALRFPADLLLLAHGTDTIANAVRFALGEAPEFGAAEGRSAALCWIPTHSGVVTEIRGVEEARAIPGIEAVVVGVGPGDAMRHVVDCESRDRVGYVLAAGDDAMAAAWAALALIEIVTKPSY